MNLNVRLSIAVIVMSPASAATPTARSTATAIPHSFSAYFSPQRHKESQRTQRISFIPFSFVSFVPLRASVVKISANDVRETVELVEMGRGREEDKVIA